MFELVRAGKLQLLQDGAEGQRFGVHLGAAHDGAGVEIDHAGAAGVVTQMQCARIRAQPDGLEQLDQGEFLEATVENPGVRHRHTLYRISSTAAPRANQSLARGPDWASQATMEGRSARAGAGRQRMRDRGNGTPDRVRASGSTGK